MFNKVSTFIDKLGDFWCDEVRYIPQIKVAKLFIYGFVLISSICYLPISEHLWGPSSCFVHYYPFTGILNKALNILSHQAILPYYVIFLYTQIVAALLMILGIAPRLMSIIVFFTYSNMYNSAGAIQNGGTNLLKICLFYFIFIDTRQKNSTPLSNALTNIGFMAIQIQVCVLYLVAASVKLFGHLWLNGDAISYVFQIPEFSHPWLATNIKHYYGISKFFTWATLAFQFLFPFLVWVKRWKSTTLSIGVLFHILIIVFMGITDFGMIMIIMYTVFLDKKSSELLLRKMKLKA